MAKKVQKKSSKVFLIIGLIIMAGALFFASKLAQKNTENRSKAASLSIEKYDYGMPCVNDIFCKEGLFCDPSKPVPADSGIFTGMPSCNYGQTKGALPAPCNNNNECTSGFYCDNTKRISPEMGGIIGGAFSGLCQKVAVKKCSSVCYTTKVGKPAKIPTSCSAYNNSKFFYKSADGTCSNNGICCKKMSK